MALTESGSDVMYWALGIPGLQQLELGLSDSQGMSTEKNGQIYSPTDILDSISRMLGLRKASYVSSLYICLSKNVIYLKNVGVVI